ncbi:MAG TPA: hypothetical protein VKR56_11655 [Candidatus Cybelea sp.]|nr:hypothetical protein [Candidatus Cybelea sp.]
MDRLMITRYSLAALGVVALTACAGTSSPGPPPALATTGVHRATSSCPVAVWATKVNTDFVYGYGAGGNFCTGVTHAGLLYANGLATSGSHLYVADKRGQILVFTTSGTFVKLWKTSIGTTTYSPWAVCVTHPPAPAVVGVTNYHAGSSAIPVAEFFSANAPNGSGPTGYASGAGLTSQVWCAFDKLGDFFVDGTTATNHQRIAYLARAHINVPAQALVNSGLGSAHDWASMYSRINAGPMKLSVNALVQCPSGCSQIVHNWKITGPAAGPLAFTPQPPYTFTGWPSSPSSPIYQLAPSTGGAAGHLYMAALYNNSILRAPANGGAVAPWNLYYQGNPLGLATVPTGQY